MVPSDKGEKMSNAPSQKSTGKMLGVVIVVAIVAAVAAILVQSLLLGHSNPAVTGGVVGAIAAVVAVGLLNKKSA
jgi:hypothetical protein